MTTTSYTNRPDITVVVCRPSDPGVEPLASAIVVTLASRGLSVDAVAVTAPDAGHAPPTPTDTERWRLVPAASDSDGDRLRAGLIGAAGQYILVVDPAVSTDPELALRLWDAREDAAVVIASRYLSSTTDRAGGWRWPFSRAMNSLARRALALRIRDVTSAYRLYRRDALPMGTLHAAHRPVQLEIIVHVIGEGWSVAEVAVGRASEPTWALGAGVRYTREFLRAIPGLWQLRNSVFSADYDERAFNSWIPLQRYWQRTRFKLVTSFVDPAVRTLDIGCGSSRIIQHLPQGVGLDIQLKKLRRVQRRNSRLVQASLSELPFADNAFETVVCSQVIEHIPRELVRWAEMTRVLVPGGVMVIGTPDYATWTWPFLEWLYDIVHPKGYVNEHINQYTAQSLREALESHGLEIVATAYVGGGELIYKAIKTPRP
ncbi:MAG: methyltransferase domain-containing protein [Vicinamibacterales bacterium]